MQLLSGLAELLSNIPSAESDTQYRSAQFAMSLIAQLLKQWPCVSHPSSCAAIHYSDGSQKVRGALVQGGGGAGHSSAWQQGASIPRS